jgi:large subunit ribosomal protein L13
MITLHKSTVSAKASEIQRQWLLVDASGKTLGRLATAIASRLRGKHKPCYTPHEDTGDYIVVINAKDVAYKGRSKGLQQKYRRHSGRPGGMKETNLADQLQKDARLVIEEAVRGMLPKNPLGRAMFRKLKVYNGSEHEHAAQQPSLVEIVN